jgi:hypothetical protein
MRIIMRQAMGICAQPIKSVNDKQHAQK